MTKRFDWHGTSGLPDISQEALKNYFLYALPPGSFLISLLSNHPWSEVVARADQWNKSRLDLYLEWLHEYAPPGSWGSEAAVEAWLAKGHDYQEFQKTVVWEVLSEDHTKTKEQEW